MGLVLLRSQITKNTFIKVNYHIHYILLVMEQGILTTHSTVTSQPVTLGFLYCQLMMSILLMLPDH